MGQPIEPVVFVVAAVVAITLIYHLLPYRRWSEREPSLVFFSKYVASMNKPEADVEASVEKPGFTPGNAGEFYARGSMFGDFSSAWIKLKVKVDRQNQEVSVAGGFFGVLFDTGDLWQLARDVTQ